MLPLYDVIPSRRRPWLNYTLIAINVLIFLWQVLLPEQVLMQTVYVYGMVPRRFWQALQSGPEDPFFWEGAIIPLFTCMFLHGGWFHILGNMWTLWIFGDNVEDAMGRFRYFVFYLLAGIIASLTHALLYPSSTVPTIGASGAISGVMGAYMMLYPASRIVTLVPWLFLATIVEIPAYIFAGVWFLGQLLGGTVSLALGGSTIAFWAHIGGFLGGMGIYRWFVLHPRIPREQWGRKLMLPEDGLEAIDKDPYRLPWEERSHF